MPYVVNMFIVLLFFTTIRLQAQHFIFFGRHYTGVCYILNIFRLLVNRFDLGDDSFAYRNFVKYPEYLFQNV